MIKNNSLLILLSLILLTLKDIKCKKSSYSFIEIYNNSSEKSENLRVTFMDYGGLESYPMIDFSRETPGLEKSTKKVSKNPILIKIYNYFKKLRKLIKNENYIYKYYFKYDNCNDQILDVQCLLPLEFLDGDSDSTVNAVEKRIVLLKEDYLNN